MANFKKLGQDQQSINIAKATGTGLGALVTGNITRGEIVEVVFPGDTPTTSSVSIPPRRTGILLSNNALDDTCEIKANFADTTLSVEISPARTGSLYYWVF